MGRDSMAEGEHSLRNVKISAYGCYVPPKVLTNQDFEKMVDTTDEWILERTGIRERHIAAPDVATSDMAVEAAKAALKQRGMEASELDVIIVCTVTPDHLFPSTACLVQHQIGATNVWGFDLIAACCSFLYGLTTGASLVASGLHKRVMVIGADTMSRITDYTDRSTCILFGDAAGAFILEPAEEGERGFVGHKHLIDGSGASVLSMPAGGSRLPPSHETVEKRLHFIKQQGQAVFKFAVKKMGDVSAALIAEHGLKTEDIAVMIPHQANKRIITACADRIKMPHERVLVNIDRYGNTTSATLPLATRDAVDQGLLKKGDYVLFAAVGAGFTVGASLWRWEI